MYIHTYIALLSLLRNDLGSFSPFSLSIACSVQARDETTEGSGRQHDAYPAQILEITIYSEFFIGYKLGH